MHAGPVNLNLRRRRWPGLLALAAAPPLRLLLIPFRRPAVAGSPVLVFSSYMIGDLFMALPALRRMAAAVPTRVVCRPDCAAILAREGLDPLPFDNAFFIRFSPRAFLRTLRAAWRLRASAGGSTALDLDADPRTAFWLRLGGAHRVLSFRRPYAVLFDHDFPLPAGAVHQADRDMAVVEAFLGSGQAPRTGAARPPSGSPAAARGESPNPRPIPLVAPHAPWILSVWTRKPAKNWPLDRWEKVLEGLEKEGVPFAVLGAPDGDAAFRRFRERWRGRAEFLDLPLPELAERVRSAAGVIATDNFLGHMAGYHGRPVLWINICSPAAQVEPRGPRTLGVRAREAHRAESLSAEEVLRAFRELRAGTTGEGLAKPGRGPSADV